MSKIETDDLLEDLKRVAEELDKTPSINEYNKHGEYSNCTITNRFGSWNEAMAAIGLEQNERKTKIDTKKLLLDLKRVANEIERAPLKSEYQEHGEYSTNPFDSRFESWEAALNAIGRESCVPVRIKKQDLFEDLDRVANQLKKAPRQEEYDEYGKYSIETFRNRFGSWNDAIVAIGRKPNANLSREHLLIDLEQVADKLQKAPTIEEYNEHGKYSSHTYYNHFDSWNDAIIKIGKEPNPGSENYSTTSRIKKEDLLEDLCRVANDLERTPKRREYQRNGNYAASTFADRFGSWNNAIIAIGKEPNTSPAKPPTAPSITKEELLEDLAQVANKIDNSPTIKEYTEYGEYSSSTIINRFDTWNNALTVVGRGTNRNVSRESLLTDLKRVANQLNKAPTKEEYNQHGKYSSTTIYNEMGAWEDAIVTIGEEPNHSGTKIDSDDLLDDLRRVHTELEKPPTTKAYRQYGNYHTSTFKRRFGSWTNSLLAIGEIPYVHRPPEILLEHVYEQATEKQIETLNNFFTNRLDFSEQLYIDQFENKWKATVRAGRKPSSAVPLSRTEYEAFIEASINFGDPSVSIYGLIRAFTGIPIRVLTKFDTTWVSRIESDIKETLLTVPAEYIAEDHNWVMILPTHYTAQSGEEKPTRLDSLLEWIDESELVSPKSQEGITERIAKEADIQVEGCEMRATVTSHLIRQGANKGDVEMQVGSKKTNWVRSVEDYMMYMYQFENYQHPEYDPTGVFLDPETGKVRE